MASSVQTFLQILGGICLAVIVLVAIGFLVIRWKWRKFAKDLENMGPMDVIDAPAQLTLVPRDRVDWSDPERATRHADDLMLHGFQSEGLFEAREMPTLFIQGFVNPARDLFAAIYNHPVAGIVVDIVQKTLDGRTLTVTSTTEGDALDSMPGKTSVRLQGAEIGPLMEAADASRLEGENLKAEPGTFRSVFETAYRQEIVWRATRGGPTAEEIRRIALASGEEMTPEVEEMMIRDQRRQANDQLHYILQTKFLEESGVSGLEWDNIQSRLVIIHDNMPKEDLELHLSMAVDDMRTYDFVDDEEEQEVDQLGFEVPDMPARDAFAAVNATFAPDRQFVLRWQCESPIAADFWVLTER